MRSLRCTLLGLALCALSGAQAASLTLASNPFAGSTANPDDGIRTVFAGNQVSLAAFDVSIDRFVFDPAHFAFGNALSFGSGLAASLAPQGLNMVVLHDTAAGFNAGTAANLIANAVNVDGAGFFVYSNRVLGVNRLVYSTNLNLNTADLSVLARIESPNGPDALAAITTFGAANFALTPVPEPGTLMLAVAGLAVVGGYARRRRI